MTAICCIPSRNHSPYLPMKTIQIENTAALYLGALSQNRGLDERF